MRRRVAITGVGVVSPLGNDVATTWQNLLNGRSGVDKIRDFPTDKLRSDIAASVRDFDAERFLSPKEVEIYGRVTHFSVAAAAEALAQAGLAPVHDPAASDDEAASEGVPTTDRARFRYGCLMSTGMGSVDIFEEQIARSAARGPRAVSPFFIPGVMPNSATAVISIRYGLMGPSYSLASACTTGTHSIATSALMIESGDADIMVAGGAEAATRLNTVAGFGNARALARAVDGDPTRASRPFDRTRHGFVMSEGAGALVLEEEQHALRRGARPLAYVTGFGMTTDATHLTRPETNGAGLAMALTRALERAELQPALVGYINPHATSTPQGDAAEVLALRQVFGERLSQIPISATKSMLGHMLGGAGAVETIAVVCSLRDQELHPSINLDELDPAFSLEVVRTRRPVDLRYAVKLSAGFGGHNCALVLERA
ncbi:beta-ketoacyl-[acyl-carrier-protein] synthase family protein [Chondromyces apiculatus]|uniref:3-oxoacyl-[acyl-carrier-protein] synthase, KASII n=1 Tax=Chondromyces apiculatus DSM 436 TaxID=1192034 RepID=A0A017T3K7_9BACT|nr:beta-ketoacyl-[acyl-carrier-protein] synthase family protein [Chondromyces apiculatus]EYF03542.1 3-oxoacyl-[acyl-carrier-protein] synthase, KASII [Chondromyces apiculatus DSM 436]